MTAGAYCGPDIAGSSRATARTHLTRQLWRMREQDRLSPQGDLDAQPRAGLTPIWESSGIATRQRSTRRSPGCDNGKMLPVRAFVQGKRAEQRLVERPYRQPAGNAVKQLGVNRHVLAGDEQQREQD